MNKFVIGVAVFVLAVGAIAVYMVVAVSELKEKALIGSNWVQNPEYTKCPETSSEAAQAFGGSPSQWEYVEEGTWGWTPKGVWGKLTPFGGAYDYLFERDMFFQGSWNSYFLEDSFVPHNYALFYCG